MTSPRAASLSAAFAGTLILTATPALAQPTLSFEDPQSTTRSTVVAGNTLDLDLILTFADGDLTAGPGLNAAGVTFDLTFANVDGSSASAPLTLSARDFTGSPFETPTAMGPFEVLSTIAAPPAGRDLGGFTFSFAADAGASPGITDLGIYSFETDASLTAGLYTIAFAGDVSTTDTSFNPQVTPVTGSPFTFEVIAVPEPTSLALLLPAAGLALARRRR